ncbi:HGGxSTG domain-containing protein [Zoogloea sp.]|uniref:HGGxSTG domain-containing protein n=1 Tax=Zoogloea sp. TaxID=49181 RepID=UPI001AC17656|nr:HGGxSTG domain-containing protein [Zoogloea sp.]MBN8285466.1 hypothetical protein [Zoogloea sp.]
MTEPCGAIKKDGTPCKQLATYENGRCKWHGGLATGPKTEAGKAQSRINGCKGGRPRKDGRETQSHGEGNIGITLETVETVATPVQKTQVIEPQDNPKTPDAQVSARVLSDVAILDAAPKTEVTDTEKSVVSAKFSVVVLASVPTSDVKVLPRGREIQEAVPEAPTVLKDVQGSPSCERCTNFAGGGKCLAVAKRIIPSMPTAGACPGFLDFDQV